MGMGDHFLFPSYSLQSLATARLLSISIDLSILDVSKRWNHSVGGLLNLASFTQHVFKVRSCCSMHLHFIPFYCRTIFHYTDTSQSVYPLISRWAHVLFPLFSHYEQSCYGHYCVSFYVNMFPVLLVELGVELLSQTVTLYLPFWGTAKLFSKEVDHFTFSPATYEGSNFFIS